MKAVTLSVSRGSWSLLLLVALGVGCASITTAEYNRDSFRRLELQDAPPKGPPDVAASWVFDGDELVVQVDRWHTCARQSTKVVHRKVVTERHMDDPTAFKLYLFFGALGVGLGVPAVLTPDSFVSDEAEDRDKDARNTLYTGVGLIAVGTGLLIMSVVDALRAIDTRRDVGEVRLPAGPAQPYGCQEDNGAGLTASLAIPGVPSPMLAEVDATGVARFALAGVPSIPDGASTVATLTIGNRQESIPLLMSPHFRKLFDARIGGDR